MEASSGASSSPTTASSARSSAASSGPRGAGREPAEVETAHGAADQPPHRVPDGVEHAPQLALAALVQHHAQPGAAAVAAQQLRLRGRRGAVVQLDALAQAGQRRVVRDALDERLVGLIDAVAGVRQAVRQLAVGGEQQQALAVAVEPPDVAQAGRRVVEQVEHRLASALVRGGDEDASRLVQQQRAIGRERGQRRAVDGDEAGGGVGAPAEFGDGAVDTHAAVADQRLDAAAAAEAVSREDLLEAFFGHGRAASLS